MTGFSTGGENTDNVKMVNATILANQLALASSLRNMDLRGTGVTESDLRAAGYRESISGTLFDPTPTSGTTWGGEPAAFSSDPWGNHGNKLNFPY